MNVGLIGLGNMGTAIAHLIASNGHSVIGWEHDERVVDQINGEHINSKYLPGVQLSSDVLATRELDDVFERCSVVFIALPSVFVRTTLEPFQNNVKKETVLVNVGKGIDRNTGYTSFQTILLLWPQNKIIMLSGPSIANEFAKGMPTVVVLAGESQSDLLFISHLLDNAFFRTRFSDDPIGVELGGILKNIYAIGLGLFDGKGIKSTNFRSVYLTVALEELANIGVRLGARRETFFYLSGLGDLLATSLSEHSHNRRMGELLARGFNLQEIETKMGVLPEGFHATRSILRMVEKLHISVPLAKALWDVIHGRCEAERFVHLLIRDFVE